VERRRGDPSVFLSAGATLAPNGAYNWTAAGGWAGSYSVTVTVNDNGNRALSAPQILTITVTAAPATSLTVTSVIVNPTSPQEAGTPLTVSAARGL